MTDYDSNDLAGAAYLSREDYYEDRPSQYEDDDYVSCCVVCGDQIAYCPGHGEIGDPEGFALRERHDADDHTYCHPNGCDDRT